MILRRAEQDELEACYQFANMVFQGAGADVTFETALPKVYAPQAQMAHIHELVLNDEGEIRALIGMLPNTLHTVCGDLRTGFIGSVSVHPQARGEGHMKRLMAFWLQNAREEHIDLMLLGGQRQRYGYFGYAQGGQCWRFQISARCVRHALPQISTEGLRFEKLECGSQAERFCLSLQQQSRAWFDREWAGFSTVCSSYEHEAFVALDEEDQPLGCVTCSRTDPSQITEILVPDCLAADRLLKAWMEQHQLKNCAVTIPVWETEMLAHLRTWAEGTSLSPAWMIRVLDPRHVIETLMNLKACWSAIPDGQLCFETEGERYTVTVLHNHCRVETGGVPDMTLSTHQLGSLLFDPFPGEDIPRGPEGWFPLPLSVPVADEF